MSTVADRVQSGRGTTGVVRGGRFEGLLGQYDQELLPAVAVGRVTATALVSDGLSDPPQDLVAREVAVMVVVRFERVYVAQRHGVVVPVALRPRLQDIEFLVET